MQEDYKSYLTMKKSFNKAPIKSSIKLNLSMNPDLVSSQQRHIPRPNTTKNDLDQIHAIHFNDNKTMLMELAIK